MKRDVGLVLEEVGIMTDTNVDAFLEELNHQIERILAVHDKYNASGSAFVSPDNRLCFSFKWGDIAIEKNLEMYTFHTKHMVTCMDIFHGMLKEAMQMLFQKQNAYAASLLDLPQS